MPQFPELGGRVQQDTTKKKVRETPAPKPRARRPVDTTALKREISAESTKASVLGRAGGELFASGRREMGKAMQKGAASAMASEGMRRARLDSARQGQIPVKQPPKPSSRIRGAMGITSSVDRIEGKTAVLEDELPGGKRRTRNAPLDSLKDPKEGRIYRQGVADPDTAEERRRREFVTRMMNGRRAAAERRDSAAKAAKPDSGKILQAMLRRPPG